MYSAYTKINYWISQEIKKFSVIFASQNITSVYKTKPRQNQLKFIMEKVYVLFACRYSI